MENDSIKQYVKNINGYYVKDEDARDDIQEINTALGNTYTKSEVNDLLGGKADTSTTLEGYNIQNAYTKTEIDERFTLSTFESPTNTTASIGTITTNNISTAKNVDGSIGKIYGTLNVESIPENTSAITISMQTSFRPSSDITINCLVFSRQYGNSTGAMPNITSLTIATTGVVTFSLALYATTTVAEFRILPCLLFITDFGDTPEE